MRLWCNHHGPFEPQDTSGRCPGCHRAPLPQDEARHNLRREIEWAVNHVLAQSQNRPVHGETFIDCRVADAVNMLEDIFKKYR